MAVINTYAVGFDRSFFNDSPCSLLNILKCAESFYPKRICAISGDKQYTRKNSHKVCRSPASALISRDIGKGDTAAAKSDCRFYASAFLSAIQREESQRCHGRQSRESVTPKFTSTCFDSYEFVDEKMARPACKSMTRIASTAIPAASRIRSRTVTEQLLNSTS